MIARVIKDSWNFPYITTEFRSWLIKNRERTFYVLDDFGTSLRLKGVNFLVSKDYIKII